jgi:hypothetical protein
VAAMRLYAADVACVLVASAITHASPNHSAAAAFASVYVGGVRVCVGVRVGVGVGVGVLGQRKAWRRVL